MLKKLWAMYSPLSLVSKVVKIVQKYSTNAVSKWNNLHTHNLKIHLRSGYKNINHRRSYWEVQLRFDKNQSETIRRECHPGMSCQKPFKHWEILVKYLIKLIAVNNKKFNFPLDY